MAAAQYVLSKVELIPCSILGPPYKEGLIMIHDFLTHYLRRSAQADQNERTSLAAATVRANLSEGITRAKASKLQNWELLYTVCAFVRIVFSRSRKGIQVVFLGNEELR